MSDYGYGDVDNVSFVAFAAALEQAPFKDHAIKSAPGVKQSMLSVFYWMLHAALHELIAAMNPDNKNPSEFDGPFDSAQRHLKDGICAHLNDPDADKAHAARTLFNGLLSGQSGIAQVQLSLEGEVDFGRAQSKLAGESPYKEHIESLGLEGRVKAAHDATEALAAAIGKTPGGATLIPRATRIRRALAACRDTFQTIHAALVLARPHADDALASQLDAWITAFASIHRA